MRHFARHFVFHAGKHTEFAFHSHVVSVCIFHHFLSERHVFVVGEVRAVDHHRRETEVHAAFAHFEAIAVVEVEADLRFFPTEFFCIFHCTLSHVAQQGLVSIVASALRHLEDYR